MIRHDWPAAQSYIDRARQRAPASQSIWMDDRLVETMQALRLDRSGELDQATNGRGSVISWIEHRLRSLATPTRMRLSASCSRVKP